MLAVAALCLLLPSGALMLGWEASQFCVAAAELCGADVGAKSTTEAIPDPLPLQAPTRRVPRRREPIKRLLSVQQEMRERLGVKKHLLQAQSKAENVSQTIGIEPYVEELNLATVAPTLTFAPDKLRRRIRNECWRRTMEEKGVLSSKIVSLNYERGISLRKAKAMCEVMLECNSFRYQRAAKFAHFLRIETEAPLLRLMLAYPHQEGWIYTC